VVRAAGAASGVTVILSHERERHILTYLEPSPSCDRGSHLEYLASARHFHMSSLFLQRALAPRVHEVFQHMKNAGLTTSLDTNDDPDGPLGGRAGRDSTLVDILLQYEREADEDGARDDFGDRSGRALRAGGRTVVVKLLGRREQWRSQDASDSPRPRRTWQVVDPVGAGDSFDAGFLHQFLRGGDLQTCLVLWESCGAFSGHRQRWHGSVPRLKRNARIFREARAFRCRDNGRRPRCNRDRRRKASGGGKRAIDHATAGATVRLLCQLSYSQPQRMIILASHGGGENVPTTDRRDAWSYS